MAVREVEDRARLYQQVWGSDAPVPEVLPPGATPLPGSPSAMARRATAEMYSRLGTLVVPSLDHPTERGTGAPGVAKSNPVLWGPVWRVSIRMGGLPIKTWRITAPEGGGAPSKQEAPDHPAYKLLRQPNGILTRSLQVAGTVFGMFVSKGVGWFKERPARGGPPVALWPVPADFLAPVRDPQRILRGYRIQVPGMPSAWVVASGISDAELADQDPSFVPEKDMLYFRLLPDPQDWASSMGPMQVLGGTGDFAAEAVAGMGAMWRSGMLGRVYVNLHGKVLEEQAQRDRLHAEMEMARANPYGAPIMEDGATLDTMGLPPNAEVMTQSLELAAKLVGHAFGLPDDVKDLPTYYSETIQPVADGMEQELERRLMTEWPGDPAFPEFMFRDVLAGSPPQRATMGRDLILSAQWTPNDTRATLWNLPPLSGGDQLFVPLNLVPIGQAGQVLDTGTPEKDSSGGLGGSEGKDTMASTRTRRRLSLPSGLPPGTAARAKVELAKRWKAARSKLVGGQSTALSRQLRGVLKRELKALRVHTRAPAARAVQAEVGYPSLDEMLGIVGASDPEVAELLHKYMAQVGDDAWDLAADLIGENAGELDAFVETVFAARSAAVGEAFGLERAGLIDKLIRTGMDQAWTIRELDDAIAARWGRLADHLVDGLARTETAFAYEQAAMGSWRQAGIAEIEFVFGGGPCTTGVCEEAADGSPYAIGDPVGDVGFSFEGADAPPLHANCTCFAVPFVGEGVLEEAEAAPSPEPARAAAPPPSPTTQVVPSSTVVFVDAGRHEPRKKVPERDPDTGDVVRVTEVPRAWSVRRDEEGRIAGLEEEED